MLFLVRPAMKWWIARALRPGRTELGLNALATVLAVVFLCAIATSLIGIFAIFGAFMLGRCSRTSTSSATRCTGRSRGS